MKARFAHVDVVAADWRRLAHFYEDVFGCVRVPPERRLEGDWLSRATGVPEAALQGVHLRLPGYDAGGPTLEVFQYSEELDRLPAAANRRGFGHVAFEVDDVAAVADRVCSEGGRMIGDIVSREIPGAGFIAFAYVADPEDNVIELQHWSTKPPSDSER